MYFTRDVQQIDGCLRLPNGPRLGRRSSLLALLVALLLVLSATDGIRPATAGAASNIRFDVVGSVQCKPTNTDRVSDLRIGTSTANKVITYRYDRSRGAERYALWFDAPANQDITIKWSLMCYRNGTPRRITGSFTVRATRSSTITRHICSSSPCGSSSASPSPNPPVYVDPYPSSVCFFPRPGTQLPCQYGQW